MSQSDGHHGARKENSMGSTPDKIKGRIKEAVGVITDNDAPQELRGQTDHGGGGGEGSRGEGERTEWRGSWRKEEMPERRQTQQCCRP